MAVLVIVFVLCGGPEGLSMMLSGDEFLLKWNSIG